ncbi:MAG: hypothetical protein GY822_15135 [Deltaproteobacteria bacterium]|nr:hypothetical protein [Deltaproteobacteria bacterium]
MELPIFGPAPDAPLCQSEIGSCAACCGIYNMRRRDDYTHHQRLLNRTRQVQRAWPDPKELKQVGAQIQSEEAADILYGTVRVCPFAGYVDLSQATTSTSNSNVEPSSVETSSSKSSNFLRVGCLLHPLRHPAGEDLRDLGVYPKEVCAGHFCANHEWLRPREKAFAKTCPGNAYGRVVTDAGFVKSLIFLLEDKICRPLRDADFLSEGRTENWHQVWVQFWLTLLHWPFQDPDPQRFGSFFVSGDDAVEYSAKGCLAPWKIEASVHHERVLDALGSHFTSSADAIKAQEQLENLIGSLAILISDA